MPEDYPFLYRLALLPEVGFRWRYRSQFPPYDVFLRELWNGVLVQFLALDSSTGSPIGYVVAYNPDLNAGWVHLGICVDPSLARPGQATDAGAAFIGYLFSVYRLRKIYLEVPEYNLPLVASGSGRFFVEEGRLRHHEYQRGRYWDQIILAVYAETVLTASSTKISASSKGHRSGEDSTRPPAESGNGSPRAL